MISSQLSQQIPEFDEIISEADKDFEKSGLKMPSIIRISRLAIVNKDFLLGSVGSIAPERLDCIKGKLAEWINGRQFQVNFVPAAG
jgi:mRNA interferase MazF